MKNLTPASIAFLLFFCEATKAYRGNEVSSRLKYNDIIDCEITNNIIPTVDSKYKANTSPCELSNDDSFEAE